MLEDELFVLAGFQNNRVLVEATDTSSQFDATDQVNRNWRTLTAYLIEKGILEVL